MTPMRSTGMTRAEFIARAVLRCAAPIGGIDADREDPVVWDYPEPKYCVERAILLADALEAAKVAPWQEPSELDAVPLSHRLYDVQGRDSERVRLSGVSIDRLMGTADTPGLIRTDISEIAVRIGDRFSALALGESLTLDAIDTRLITDMQVRRVR
jgi:hypothetical protein